MNPSISYRAIVVSLSIFGLSVVHGQENGKPNTEDSTISIVDSASRENIGDNTSPETPIEKPPVDTFIVSRPNLIKTSAVNRIKKDKGFSYQSWLDSALRANDAKVKSVKPIKPFKLPDFSLFYSIFEIVLWVLAGAVLLFVIYKLFLSRTGLFTRNRKNIDAVIEVEEAASVSDLERRLHDAENAQQFRLAVRYLHLLAIQHLAEQNFIQRGTEKTNYQYQHEIRTRSASLAQLFATLTLRFDYIWYGEYPVNQNMYAVLKRDFHQFYQQTAHQ